MYVLGLVMGGIVFFSFGNSNLQRGRDDGRHEGYAGTHVPYLGLGNAPILVYIDIPRHHCQTALQVYIYKSIYIN